MAGSPPAVPSERWRFDSIGNRQSTISHSRRASLLLVLLDDALERVALGDLKAVRPFLVDALNHDFVLTVILYRPSGQDDRCRSPHTQRPRPEVQQVFTIVDDERGRVSRVPALAPPSRAPVNRSPH